MWRQCSFKPFRPPRKDAALFGVYGMLGVGMMLFRLRGLFERGLHADGLLEPAFRCLNIGLATMVCLAADGDPGLAARAG